MKMIDHAAAASAAHADDNDDDGDVIMFSSCASDDFNPLCTFFVFFLEKLYEFYVYWSKVCITEVNPMLTSVFHLSDARKSKYTCDNHFCAAS